MTTVTQNKATPLWHCQKVVIGPAHDPYLIRWSFSTPLGSVKLHHIIRSDEDRDLHDHPWSFLSIILRGGYWEHTHTRCKRHPASDLHSYQLRDGYVSCLWCGESRFTLRHWFGPGRVLWRPRPSVHRLELPVGKTAWSLVFTGPRRSGWGFHTVCGFIPWFKYNDAKADGC